MRGLPPNHGYYQTKTVEAKANRERAYGETRSLMSRLQQVSTFFRMQLSFVLKTLIPNWQISLGDREAKSLKIGQHLPLQIKVQTEIELAGTSGI